MSHGIFRNFIYFSLIKVLLKEDSWSVAFLNDVLGSGPILDSVCDRWIESAGSFPLRERIFLKDHKDCLAILDALQEAVSLKRYHLIYKYYKHLLSWAGSFSKE